MPPLGRKGRKREREIHPILNRGYVPIESDRAEHIWMVLIRKSIVLNGETERATNNRMRETAIFNVPVHQQLTGAQHREFM